MSRIFRAWKMYRLSDLILLSKNLSLIFRECVTDNAKMQDCEEICAVIFSNTVAFLRTRKTRRIL
jgi:hypothetical protein